METIIYIFQDNRQVIKEFDMRDYRLLRVGVSQEFMRILQEKEPEDVCEAHRNESAERGGLWIRLGLGCMFRKLLGIDRRLAKEAMLRRQQLLAEEERQRQTFWKELLTDPDYTYFYCEEEIPFLKGRCFGGYWEEEWVMHMMGYTSHHHFLFLGRVRFMPRLILTYVKRMKSMRWILLQRQYGTEEENLVEDIYEQYGLLIDVQLLGEEKDYRRLRLNAYEATVVVDFSGEDKITPSDLPEGSIWLDMSASEVKRGRMEEREKKIRYFSLKKEWKQPEKALIYLDTTYKNGYNT